MRVGVDAHALGTQAGGNETFVRTLLRGLHRIAPETEIIAYVNPDLPDAAGCAEGFAVYPLVTRSSWARVAYGLARAVCATRPDVLHVQYIAPPAVTLPRRCALVVTLHDVIWRRLPESLPRAQRWRLALLTPETLRRATRVFVVTEAMRREAVACYRLEPDRIDVVGNAVDARYFAAWPESELARVRRRYGLPDLYVLYVGRLQPRKNVVRLAQAVALLRARGLPHGLVLAGKPDTRYDEVARALTAPVLRGTVHFTGYVPDADLPGLMQAADALGYVSLYEGFGIPVIEAMASGTPVVTSTAPALVEVAGGAAVAADPLDVEAITDALESVLTDEALRAMLRKRGRDRAACFTCEAMAGAALAGYEAAYDTVRR